MTKASAHSPGITACYHCGEDVVEKGFRIGEKDFCCMGCKTVYEILNDNGLCEYYDLESQPGINQRQAIREGKFGFLDDEKVVAQLLHFRQGRESHVRFYLPQMHCSSCIWLLENLGRVNAGVLESRVDFVKKEVTLKFDSSRTTLREVAETLTRVGYEPHISLNDLSGKKIRRYDSTRIIKIGLAGFCFGNIMMLSFPEYFSLSAGDEPGLKHWFSGLNLLLSLPVFFYCASEFFVSAYKALRQKFLNIDAPIALAILVTFGRSVYEILSGSGAGYLDSMSGIVFFMLVGRYFQNRSYQGISFERDYTSYFPLGVTVILENGEEKQIPVSDIRCGDRIKIHHDEIIPADAMLFMGQASIDYSFVTGESMPVQLSIGEIVYAGGKQCGAAIELEVIKETSQSYLTQLWNNDSFRREKREDWSSFVHYLSRYFTYVLFGIAIATALYWQLNDPTRTWQAFTAVLIVACPCALLLSATFTHGSVLAKLHQKHFFVKNAAVVEAFKDADTVVFDKTGTLSMQTESSIVYSGSVLSQKEQQLLRTLAAQSSHPLSKAIVSHLPVQPYLKVKEYAEQKGKGSSAIIAGHVISLGSHEFITGIKTDEISGGSRVYLSIDGEIPGHFTIQTRYREDLKTVISSLAARYKLALISGDNNSEEEKLRALFGELAELRFRQQPQAKLDYISHLQSLGHRVIMIGDGLNDAGALQQSDIGIAISDNINNFSPACDAILEGKMFKYLPELIRYCRLGRQIIYGSFAISILYNLLGLYFAVSGTLSPVIAAILMPVSSVSIVSFTTGLSALLAARITRARAERGETGGTGNIEIK
ncbi:MAG TPA: heavy metal translocating P-type ATPase metal-binding domain-containing protein [Bacteroidia bacterium]|nr:heavy metal translocating P-type ATPase metal-binding domain-containing protein [Bacteroidia bacterium]